MGKAQKKSNNVIETRRAAFFTKMEEYNKLTLEELKELFNHPDKKIRPGGIYRQALIEVVRKKQIAAATEAIKEGTEEVKQEEATIAPETETNT